MTHFSLNKALQLSWQSVKRDWKVWLVAGLILGLAGLPQEIVSLNQAQEFSFAVLFWLVIGAVITLLFTPGIQQNGLLAARGSAPTIPVLTQGVKMAGKFLVFYFLYLLMVGLGFIALIIPGIYLMIRYGFTPYILLDNPNLGIAEAMKQSSELTKGRILELIGAVIVLGVISGGLSLIIGVIISIFVDPNTVSGLIAYDLLFLIPSVLIMPLGIVGAASIYDQVKSKPIVDAPASI